MKYLICLLLFCASLPAYSNEFRVCGWRIDAERTHDDQFELIGSENVPFAVHLSWRGSEGHGRLRHCGGAIVARDWVLTARHCVGDIRWAFLGVDVPSLDLSTKADLALCPVDAAPFPKQDVALLRLVQPLPEGVALARIGPAINAFPVSGHIGRWPVRRGQPARQMLVSPISVEGMTPTPMLSGRMVFAHERVPCGGESGSMLMLEDGTLGGVLTAISSPTGGRPNCNEPQTRIFMTPLASWREWVEEAVAACSNEPERCVRPE